MEGTSLRFAEAARALTETCRTRSLSSPSFRSPPRIPGDRSIRRRADGGASVAVRYRDRPWSAVLADMVEGVVVTNHLVGADADAARTALWVVLEQTGDAPSPAATDAPGQARPRGPRLRSVA